jgi:hypothetical protein
MPYTKPISCAEYIASLNSINQYLVYLNPEDEYDYFIFQHGSNKDAIPDHYISIGSMSHFNFDGNVIAAQDHIDSCLND